MPDATTLLNFRRLLLANDLTKTLFDEINAHLADKGLLMRAGTIVDATIIAASSSTKNAKGKRDPDMHQAKKGNQWHFAMKAHIGVDAESGLVHPVIGTAANVNDVTQAGALEATMNSPVPKRRRRRDGSRSERPIFTVASRLRCLNTPPIVPLVGALLPRQRSAPSSAPPLLSYQHHVSS